MDNESKIKQINDEVRYITRDIHGVKVTSTYLISTELYKIETDKLIELVTKKFLNHPATIFAIIGTEENLLLKKDFPHWKIPTSNLQLKDIINKEINKYLDLYFLQLENRKLNFLETQKGYNFTKIIFTPLIEGDNLEISLSFIALTIFSNGSILIELFENLKNIEYLADFYHPFSFIEYKFFPRFDGKNKTYSLNSGMQLNDLRMYIISELTKINNNNHFNELSFFTHFITNMEEMNKIPQFKKHKLYTWLVNAPYVPENFFHGLTLDDSSKYLRTEVNNHEIINYISKGTNYIVWNSQTEKSDENELFLDQASFFLSAATPFFQITTLDETITYGIERFQLKDRKKLLDFNEWAHKYRKTFLHIYRARYMSLIDLFIELREKSDFKNYKYISEIKEEEIKIIQEKNSFQESLKNRNMEILIYIISTISVLQVVDIFTNDKKFMSIFGIFILFIAISIYFRKK